MRWKGRSGEGSRSLQWRTPLLNSESKVKLEYMLQAEGDRVCISSVRTLSDMPSSSSSGGMPGAASLAGGSSGTTAPHVVQVWTRVPFWLGTGCEEKAAEGRVSHKYYHGENKEGQLQCWGAMRELGLEADVGKRALSVKTCAEEGAGTQKD